MSISITYPGNPAHPDHLQFIAALGRATWEAAYFAGGLQDLLRVHHDLDYFSLVGDSAGQLKVKLAARAGRLPGLEAAVAVFAEAIGHRNALLHATPVADGLEYRSRDGDVVDFYEVAGLESVRSRLAAASRLANEILYHDGGEAVRRYTEG